MAYLLADGWLITMNERRDVLERASVLVEKDGVGRTEQFMQISVPGFGAGQIVLVMVTGVADEGLIGEAVRTAA